MNPGVSRAGGRWLLSFGVPFSEILTHMFVRIGNGPEDDRILRAD
jgi:hypothetical protein